MFQSFPAFNQITKIIFKRGKKQIITSTGLILFCCSILLEKFMWLGKDNFKSNADGHTADI